eukprot:TRINITY_DN293_c0_g1_i1.p1 TRINITY_DN293_c0_g1~~TRINITY_DN293_c0_g1_i1.p1  ORF type:complete len:551 (+),score=135.90 TRINITY_DN293_c0_g1_i1:46-1698(+)
MSSMASTSSAKSTSTSSMFSASRSSSSSRATEMSKSSEKQKDVRMSNITATKAVCDVIRTSLGPKGMDKMITDSSGETLITNDGATILSKMDVQHPAARMLVDAARAQDVEAGDGTTTVAVIAGALCTAAQDLLTRGIHPSIIAESFLYAQQKGCEYAKKMQVDVDLSNRNALINAAVTSLNSKVVSSTADKLAPIAIDAVLKIMESKTSTTVDLNDIKVVKKLGGTIEDTELIDGLVFTQSASHAAGGPTKISNAKIGLIQFQLSAPKTNMENSIVVEDYQQVDRILKEERAYIQKLLKPIIKSGINVLLIQKSILRDAVNELALHYLAKANIMVVKDIERTDVEFICQTLGCIPIADVTQVATSKLGQSDKVDEISTSGGKIIKITGVKNPGKTVSVLIHGSNRLVLDEAERSLHDALCVARCLVKQRSMLPGGGAPEIEMAIQLEKHASTLSGMKAFCVKTYARSLELIPYTLAENAGLHPISIVSQLRKKHDEGKTSYGINVKKGEVTDMTEEKVVQPLLVTTSALNLATECVRMLLKIDDIVLIR